jgi:small subunit ribosomal protein S14
MNNDDTLDERTDRSGERTGKTHECLDTGRTNGLVGKYDIWLCRQSFRELAPKMGFKKYD